MPFCIHLPDSQAMNAHRGDEEVPGTAHAGRSSGCRADDNDIAPTAAVRCPAEIDAESASDADDADADDGNSEIEALLQTLPYDDRRGRRGGLHHRGKSLSSFFRIGINRGHDEGNNADDDNNRRSFSAISGALAGSMGGSISRGLEAIAEDVQATARDVGGALATELRDADMGETCFLDAAMTRSLAVLPDDIAEMVEEAAEVAPHVAAVASIALPAAPTDCAATEEKAVPSSEVKRANNEAKFIADGGDKHTVPPPPLPRRGVAVLALAPYMSLLGAVAAVSSNGTAMSLLHDVPPPLKLYWRMTATAAFLGAAVVARRVRRGVGHASSLALGARKKDEPLPPLIPTLSAAQWTAFGLAVMCFAVQTLLFVIALEYTSVGNAVIFGNSQALLLLLGKACVGESILPLEGMGALVAFVGAVLCSRDTEGSSSSSDDEAPSLSMLGDLLALGSAVGGVGFLAFAKAVRPHMSVTLFMFLVMLGGSFLVLAFMEVTAVPIHWSTHPYHGLFGWLNWRPDRLLLEGWIAVVCNIMGSMGFVRAMQHFDNLIIAVATLSEPLMASIIAYACSVGNLPGPLGWAGNFLVIVGTIGVVFPSVNKAQSH